MDELRERVAQAIYEAPFVVGDRIAQRVWEHAMDRERQDAFAAADAALAALADTGTAVLHLTPETASAIVMALSVHGQALRRVAEDIEIDGDPVPAGLLRRIVTITGLVGKVADIEFDDEDAN